MLSATYQTTLRKGVSYEFVCINHATLQQVAQYNKIVSNEYVVCKNQVVHRNLGGVISQRFVVTKQALGKTYVWCNHVTR